MSETERTMVILYHTVALRGMLYFDIIKTVGRKQVRFAEMNLEVI